MSRSSKRQRTGRNYNRDNPTITSDFRIQRFYENAPHNFTYYVVPLKNGQPSGKSIRLKFNNIYSPNSKALSESITSKNVTCSYKTFKTTNTVVSWRYTQPQVHDTALYVDEYKLTYKYRLKAKAIDAFKDYNESIRKSGWAIKYVQPLKLIQIENDPWFLIEWEDKIQDLGISKDTKKHFNLTQCDAIGVAFGLDPKKDSRVLQYCVASIDQLCHSKGGTVVLHKQFIKHATETINKSEMNQLAKVTVSPNFIKQISQERSDYFFVGRTDMHNMKLFISSRELWKAQNYIIDTIQNLLDSMNTPYFQERELILSAIKGKLHPGINLNLITNILGSNPTSHIPNLSHILTPAPQLWFQSQTEQNIQTFMKLTHIPTIDQIQRKAIHMAINEHFSIVSGGPGRGKSSCVLRGILYTLSQLYSLCYKDPIDEFYTFRPDFPNLPPQIDTDTVLEIVQATQNIKPFICVHVLSFTGKAVSRIKELMKPAELFFKFNPMTIHRLFARCNQYKWLTEVPTILIIDEVSMVSDILFYSLIRRFKNIQKIILLGDFDQLPPIQPGDLLQELILSRCVPVTRLIKNYRQGTGSGLPNIADKIIGRESKRHTGSSRIYGGWDHALNIPTQKNKDDLYHIQSIFGGSEDCKIYGYPAHVPEEQIFQDIVKQVQTLGLNPNIDLFTDCVVLAAKRIEVAKLNCMLQPAFMGIDEIADKGLRGYFEGIEFDFIPGDRIMHLENNYDINVFNGDIGRVITIDHRTKELEMDIEGEPQSKTVQLENIMPAYSQTVHKVQGSEYNIVIIYISDQASMLHVDQWLYTAFTRAKQKVFIFGYTGEIISTVSKELEYRRTFLKQRLQLECSMHLNDLVKDELTNVPK